MEKPLYALDPTVHDISDQLYEDSKFMQNLFQFLEKSIQPPYSLSVNGNWGMGKTSLMQALQKRFEASKYPVLWFNAWEYERVEDIVFCFLVELTRYAKTKLGDALQELGIFGLSLFASGLDLTARLLTGNKLSFDSVSKIEKEVREALKGKYDDVHPTKQIKKDFAELTQKIAKKHDDRPLIVFLDDLDRCLPENALELLESLKNLFIVPKANVIFIAGVDTHVAKQFIIKRYEGLDEEFAYNYFKKIFNLTLNVPFLTKERYQTLIRTRIEELFAMREPDKAKKGLQEKIVICLADNLIKAGVQSIRQAYNILQQWYLLINVYPEKRKQYDVYLALLTLKECWPGEMEKLSRYANEIPDKTLRALRQRDDFPENLFFRATFNVLWKNEKHANLKNNILLEI